MAGGNPSNPLDELAGLQRAIKLATAGVISRTITVRMFDLDNFWPGPWPLIQLRLFRWRIYRRSGGRTGTKGQDARKPNLYTIELRDVINVRDVTDDSELVAASQRDCLLLIPAIAEYFDHLPNRLLLDENGLPCAQLAGDDIDIQGGPPLSEDTGDREVYFAGTISVVGNPHLVSET